MKRPRKFVEMTPALENLIELCFSFRKVTVQHSYFRVLIQLYVRDVDYSFNHKYESSIRKILDEYSFDKNQDIIFQELYDGMHPARNIAELYPDTIFMDNGAFLPLPTRQINKVLSS